MSKDTWTHEVLGELTLEGNCWVGEIGLPGFAKFDLPVPVGKYPLFVASDSESEKQPAADLVDLAVSAVESEAWLSDIVPQAVLDDLTGEGPDSASPWCAALEEGLISIFRATPPREVNDLCAHMALKAIDIRRGLDDGEPRTEFEFSTSWEQEHGNLIVLVQYDEVTGLGYSGYLGFGEEVKCFDD